MLRFVVQASRKWRRVGGTRGASGGRRERSVCGNPRSPSSGVPSTDKDAMAQMEAEILERCLDHMAREDGDDAEILLRSIGVCLSNVS